MTTIQKSHAPWVIGSIWPGSETRNPANGRMSSDGSGIIADSIAIAQAIPSSSRRGAVTITETLGLGEFQTEIDRTLTLTDRKGAQRDLTDDEIERAIAEIQATIKRYKT